MIIGKNLEMILSAVREGIYRLVNGKQVIGIQTVYSVVDSTFSTLTVPTGTTEAWITVEHPNNPQTGVARYTIDGTNPVGGAISTSTTIGHVMFFNGIPLVIKNGDAVRNFKITRIPTTGQTNITITYFR
jgi:hypothetical protein